MGKTPRWSYAPTEPALKHPIVDALGPNRAVLLPGAAPIHIAGGGRPGWAGAAPVDPDLVPVAILRTAPRRRGPKASLGRCRSRWIRRPMRPAHWSWVAAVEERSAASGPGGGTAAKQRLVLFSCPAMAENVFQDIERTNLDMLMIAAGWLRGPLGHHGDSPAHARRADALGRSGASAAADPDPVVRGTTVDHRHGSHRFHRPARMMKTHRTTYTLVVLFFASLLVLWGLEYSGVRTAKENRLRESLILPELLETPATAFAKSRSSAARNDWCSKDAAPVQAAGRWSSR